MRPKERKLEARKFADGICELSSPRVGVSASCPVTFLVAAGQRTHARRRSEWRQTKPSFTYSHIIGSRRPRRKRPEVNRAMTSQSERVSGRGVVYGVQWKSPGQRRRDRDRERERCFDEARIVRLQVRLLTVAPRSEYWRVDVRRSGCRSLAPVYTHRHVYPPTTVRRPLWPSTNPACDRYGRQ